MSREVHHPFFARFLAGVTARAEGGDEDHLRRELLAGLSGRVIEIGAGTGPNFRSRRREGSSSPAASCASTSTSSRGTRAAPASSA
jgi:hypothetical protein